MKSPDTVDQASACLLFGKLWDILVRFDPTNTHKTKADISISFVKLEEASQTIHPR
jgi:hypothetical protein